MTQDEIRYPIGEMQLPASLLTADQFGNCIHDLAILPLQLEKVSEGLSEEQLDTPYREGGWSIRQIIHHVADSHLNGYVRLKWALTEDAPTIKAYSQALWAEQYDAAHAPVELSVSLLKALHQRWLLQIEHLSEAERSRTFLHPEGNITYTVDQAIALYTWHGKHHLAQIHNFKERMGW